MGTQSLMRILDCFFAPYVIKDGVDPPTPEELQKLDVAMESFFLFSLIWSVGVTTTAQGRTKFNETTSKWVTWMDGEEAFVFNPSLTFNECVVPTKDSVRNLFLLEKLLNNGKHVLAVGPTGTGKTVNIMNYLQTGMDQRFVPLTLSFSARTSAAQTQQILDSK